MEQKNFLYKKIVDLGLSVRTINCLYNADILYVGELVQKSERELLCFRNFGRKSLNELKKLLYQNKLGFGMQLKGFDPAGYERGAPGVIANTQIINNKTFLENWERFLVLQKECQIIPERMLFLSKQFKQNQNELVELLQKVEADLKMLGATS